MTAAVVVVAPRPLHSIHERSRFSGYVHCCRCNFSAKSCNKRQKPKRTLLVKGTSIRLHVLNQIIHNPHREYFDLSLHRVCVAQTINEFDRELFDSSL